MTEQEAYAKGLEKLGLQATFNDLLLDVRRDPAFAWRVFCSFTDGPYWGDLVEDACLTTDTPGEWLYAKVCQLGREDS